MPWQMMCADPNCGNVPVSSGWSHNVVWGAKCGGGDCTAEWSAEAFATADGDDTVVWGTGDDDTVVWGTSDVDTVVWGTSEGDDTVVWGTSCTDPGCAPIVWQQ
jgi:hypothetical protein